MLAANAQPTQMPDAESAAEMPQMMLALDIEPALVALDHPALFASMQTACAGCGSKEGCRQDLADGTAGQEFTAYCGNASTLAVLAQQATLARD